MEPKKKQLNRDRRHARIRAKIFGVADRPRITVFKSNKHIFVQAIDDAARKTLVGVSDKKTSKGAKSESAFSIGEHVGAALKKMNIETAIFDKGGFAYHGRIKSVAEGLRKAGVKI